MAKSTSMLLYQLTFVSVGHAICHYREQSTLDHPWLGSSVVEHLVYNQGGLGSIPSLAKYLGLTGMGTLVSQPMELLSFLGYSSAAPAFKQ